MFCCPSNGLCAIMNAVSRYSIDGTMTRDVDCTYTGSHMDRNPEKLASEQVCFEH